MKHPHYLCLLYGNNCHHKGTPLKTPRPLFSLTPLKWLFILPVVSLQGWTLGRSSVHATLPTPHPHYYPNLSTHLSRTAPHRNCQKRFPSLLGAPPYSPRMTLPFKVLFNRESFLHPMVNTLPWRFIWFSKMILNKYLLRGRKIIIFSLE